MVDVAVPSRRLKARPLLLIGGAIGVLVAAALVLWAQYGATVFFEMIRAGFVACL